MADLGRRILRCAGLVTALWLSALSAWPVEFKASLPSGARVFAVRPDAGWNGDLIVYAHGYAPPGESPDFQNLDFGGIHIPELASRLGFAFAATTYRRSGLAVVEGVQDVVDAAAWAASLGPRPPRRVLVVGVSEGGLVATLAVERHPDRFAGGLALCGPIGDFRRQIAYDADFRAVFDWFYPGLIPGDAVTVPEEVRAHWYDQYEPLVRAALDADPARALQLMAVTRAAYIPGDFQSIRQTAGGVLWYQVFGTEDAFRQLGGCAYGNRLRRYAGSADDKSLNAGIDRFVAEPLAVANVAPYQASGRLARPLIVLHTTGDEIVPYEHVPLYAAKALRAGASTRLRIIPVRRYGHCQFEVAEVLAGLAQLLRETR